jgi:hypothetical protein
MQITITEEMIFSFLIKKETEKLAFLDLETTSDMVEMRQIAKRIAKLRKKLRNVKTKQT